MAGAGRYLLVALVAAAVALGASWTSRNLLIPHEDSGGELHAIIHQQLDLDAEQEAKVEALEKNFADRRSELESKLRQANAELAESYARTCLCYACSAAP